MHRPAHLRWPAVCARPAPAPACGFALAFPARHAQSLFNPVL